MFDLREHPSSWRDLCGGGALSFNINFFNIMPNTLPVFNFTKVFNPLVVPNFRPCHNVAFTTNMGHIPCKWSHLFWFKYCIPPTRGTVADVGWVLSKVPLIATNSAGSSHSCHGSFLLSFFRNDPGNSLRSFAACLMRVAFFPCRIEFGKEKTVCSGFTEGSANCCSNHGPYAWKDYGARYCSTSSADCEPRPTVFEEALAFPPCHVDTRLAGGLYVHSVEKVMSSVLLRRCENV